MAAKASRIEDHFDETVVLDADLLASFGLFALLALKSDRDDVGALSGIVVK
jgi:hypothetical protein